jgi:uncharacterized protein Usg
MGVILGGGYTCSNCGQYHRTYHQQACRCKKKKETKSSDKIPTAEEFFKNEGDFISNYDVQRKAIELAQLHVEAALKAADFKAQVIISEREWEEIEQKDFILKAYPKENIK